MLILDSEGMIAVSPIHFTLSPVELRITGASTSIVRAKIL